MRTACRKTKTPQRGGVFVEFGMAGTLAHGRGGGCRDGPAAGVVIQSVADTGDFLAFECGEPVLNEWLQRRALPNQLTGASRTFVVADKHGRVYGYYAMAAGAVAHQMATSSVRRNMPDPVPVMVLARLAVDRRAQGVKLGASLLQDAVRRAIGVSQNAGVRPCWYTLSMFRPRSSTSTMVSRSRRSIR